MNGTNTVLLVVLVALAAVLVGMNLKDDPVVAQGYPGGTVNSNERMIAVTGTIGSGVSVLYVIDSLDKRLAVYHCKGGKSIELVAARNIEWDFKIETLNDISRRSPSELRRLYHRGVEKDVTAPENAEDKGAGSGQDPVPGGNEEDK